MNQEHTQQSHRAGSILIIDDDPGIISIFNTLFAAEYSLLTAPTAEEGYILLQDNKVSVLVCNEHLSGEQGLQFMARIADEFKHVQPVLMSEGIDEDLLYFAINDVGVLKYLKKPLSEEEVMKAVSSAHQHYLKSIEIDTITTDYNRIREEVKSIPYIAQRIRQATSIILTNIWTTALAASGTITLMLFIFLILGITVLIVLYVLKSFLGINIFAELHLEDILKSLLIYFTLPPA